jgi:hypothetical protein
MNDTTHQLALAMLSLFWVGVMLVTGQLYMEYREPRALTVKTSSTDRRASVFSIGTPDFVRVRLAERARLEEPNESSTR